MQRRENDDVDNDTNWWWQELLDQLPPTEAFSPTRIEAPVPLYGLDVEDSLLPYPQKTQAGRECPEGGRYVA